MQVTVRLILAILLAHLLADFPLQTDAMVAAKKDRKLPFLKHGLLHFLTLLAVLALFTNLPLLSLRVVLLLTAYIVLHVGLDVLKSQLVRWRVARDSVWLFLSDQAAHLATILGLTWMFTRYQWAEVRAAIVWSDTEQLHVLVVAVLYVAVIFGGGYLVRYLTRSLALHLPSSKEESSVEIRNAGLYIGWLERFLVLTAVLVQSPAMIGLILTGKSIARYSELKGGRFAEYFLIGTFLSISLALLGGIVLLQVLLGTVSFK
jgi:Protein of unknown function (DUF3307)